MTSLARPILDKLGPSLDPSVSDRVRAGINLSAVLPRLDDLARLDPEAGKIVGGMDVGIALVALNGPRIALRFSSGRVLTDPGDVHLHLEHGTPPKIDVELPDVGLLFSSCRDVNRMFDGERVLPVPVGKLWRFRDLQRFTRLTEILTKYLKPSPSDMIDSVFRARHVEMALLVGLNAAHVIARHDPKGRRIASHLPTGTIQYVIHGGPSCYVTIGEDSIVASPGLLEEPTATIEIEDVDLAVSLIEGTVDTFAANGSGAIKATGSLPLADEFNTLFDRVGLYLE